MKIFVYPGGHIDPNDANPLEASKREITEETGLIHFKEVLISNNNLIPIDIDTHTIEYNKRLNLPRHYHFDFRYLYTIDRISDISIDTDESSEYKWIDINKLENESNYKEVIKKIRKLLII